MRFFFLLLATATTAFGEPPHAVNYCSQYFVHPAVPADEQDAVLVRRSSEGENLDTYFQRTNRSLAEIRNIYGAALAPELLRGKRVLDVACGGGRFVRELRQSDATIEAKGVDLYLDDSQKSEPHVFTAGDALALPYADGSFDFVVATQGPLQYYGWDSDVEEVLWWQALSESLRVMDANATLLVSAATPYVDERIAGLGESYAVETLAPGVYRIRHRVNVAR